MEDGDVCVRVCLLHNKIKLKVFYQAVKIST